MKRRALISTLILFAGLFSHAQGILRLPEAVNIALQNSLEIKLANNRIATDSLFDHYGVAGGLPVVTATLNDNEQLTSVNQKLNTGTEIKRSNAAANNFSSNITGTILLYNGGRVVATKKRLAELESQSRELLNSQVQNILADVMTGFYDIVRQQNYLRTIDTSIAASRQQLQIVQVRQQAGLANNADLFQAQIDLNALEQSKLAQQLVIEQAKTELMRLLNLPGDSSVVVEDSIVVDQTLLLEPLLNNLNKNTDLLAAEKQIRINEYALKETVAQRYPSIRATTGYSFSRNQAAAGNLLLNQNYGPTIGVGITIPIYNGAAFRRQQKAAEINVQNAAIQKQIVERDYHAQLLKQYQAYRNTISQLDSAQQNFHLSQKLLNLALLRFQYKQATILEVKSAQQSFEQSGFRLVNLRFAAKSSEIELKRLTNGLRF
jgi:outer membrane protein TolC